MKKLFTRYDLYLDYLENDMTIKEISKKYSLSERCISYKLNKYGLSKKEFIKRKNYLNGFLEPTFNNLYKLYIIKNLTQREVAKIINKSKMQTYRYLNKFGIKKPVSLFIKLKYLLSNFVNNK